MSFLLAVIGAWDKIASIYYNWSLNENEKKIAGKEKQLAEVKKLNEQPNYIFAYALQKLFIMVMILFLAYMTGLSDAHVTGFTSRLGWMAVVSSCFGSLFGDGYRVCRWITHYEQVVYRLEKQLIL